ncbi:MAG: M48 family metallopeptidase [Roseburia sp.]|nr:M48 family metallopeptidase [Roseburia sp.]
MFEYEYVLKRSARRTISVSVRDDNTITVSAPLKTSEKEIEKFLLSKQDWLELHIRRNERNNAFLSDVILYKKILVAGREVPLKICGENKISDDGVCAKSLKNVKKLLIDNLGGKFSQIFNEIKINNNFKCGRVEFKDYKSKWGCCDGAGNITFNYKLLMLPPELWRYVAVHELCHTVYMNHSENFYALVASVLPDYKQYRRQLKLYSRITRLY